MLNPIYIRIFSFSNNVSLEQAFLYLMAKEKKITKKKFDRLFKHDSTKILNRAFYSKIYKRLPISILKKFLKIYKISYFEYKIVMDEAKNEILSSQNALVYNYLS